MDVVEGMAVVAFLVIAVIAAAEVTVRVVEVVEGIGRFVRAGATWLLDRGSNDGNP